MKKYIIVFVLIVALLLCSCSSKETVTNEGKEQEVLTLLEGYWYCEEGVDGAEFIAIKDGKFARGYVSFNEEWADIKDAELMGDDEITFDIIYSDKKDKKNKYGITLDSEDDFKNTFEYDDGDVSYDFVRMGKDRCDFMVNLEKEKNNPPIAIAFAPTDYKTNKNQYQYVTNEAGEYVTDIIIYSDGSIKDFELVKLENVSGSLHVTDVVHTQKQLSDDKHIVTGISIPEFVSTSGMRFVDSNGKKWVFAFYQSGRNGSLGCDYRGAWQVYNSKEKNNGISYDSLCGYWAMRYDFVYITQSEIEMAVMESDVGRAGIINNIYTDNQGKFLLDVTLEEVIFGYSVDIPQEDAYVVLKSDDNYTKSITVDIFGHESTYNYFGTRQKLEEYIYGLHQNY